MNKPNPKRSSGPTKMIAQVGPSPLNMYLTPSLTPVETWEGKPACRIEYLDPSVDLHQAMGLDLHQAMGLDLYTDLHTGHGINQALKSLKNIQKFFKRYPPQAHTTYKMIVPEVILNALTVGPCTNNHQCLNWVNSLPVTPTHLQIRRAQQVHTWDDLPKQLDTSEWQLIRLSECSKGWHACDPTLAFEPLRTRPLRILLKNKHKRGRFPKDIINATTDCLVISCVHHLGHLLNAKSRPAFVRFYFA